MIGGVKDAPRAAHPYLFRTTKTGLALIPSFFQAGAKHSLYNVKDALDYV